MVIFKLELKMKDPSLVFALKRAQTLLDIPRAEDSLISVVEDKGLYRGIRKEDDPDDMLHASTSLVDAYNAAVKYQKCVFLQNEIGDKGWVGSLLEEDIISKLYSLWVLYRVSSNPKVPDTNTSMSRMAATVSLNRIEAPFINITKVEAAYLTLVHDKTILGVEGDYSFVEVPDKLIIFRYKDSLAYELINYYKEYQLDLQSGNDKLSLFETGDELFSFLDKYPEVVKIGLMFRNKHTLDIRYYNKEGKITKTLRKTSKLFLPNSRVL